MNSEQIFEFHKIKVKFFTCGTGKPLVMLHGWGVDSGTLRDTAEALSDLRSCYLVDLPGFGDAPEPPEAWSVDDYADLVEAFIRELETPVDILAHSFGGRITLKLCAREGSDALIDSVLITGGAGMKPQRSAKFYLRKYFAKALKAPFQLLPGGMQERGLGWLRSTKLWKSLGSSDYKQLSGVMRETFVRTVSEYLEPCLPKIDQEVLLLWGENDSATPLYQAKRMENGLKNAALVTIDHAGHYAFLDRPKRFQAIARAFFEG